MHRCCQNSNSMAGHGSCSCGGSYHHAQSSPFSVLFPDPYSYPNQYSSAPVDCTLSLGTPSTRLSEDADDTGRRFRGSGRERQSPVSNFCWDILQTAKHASPSAAANKASGRSGGDSGGGHDPLLARRCANCDTTSTPLWRNGPRGPKSLCNACGIRFKKEERRATAAAATAAASTGSMMDDAQPMFSHGQYGSWAAAAASHHQKLPCFGTEYSFIDDQARDHSDNGFSFLSWRASGLVHDFTR